MAKATWKSGIFAMALMMLIYGLIAYMGASSVTAIGTFDNGGQIFAAVADHYFGSYGAILLAIIIVLACLKTSIGLITSCSEFFHEVFPKISYKTFVVVLCIVSFAIANFGLTNIITFAIPVLMFLYPLAIVLIILALVGPLFNYKQPVFAVAILFTFFISLIDGYNALIASVPAFEMGILTAVAKFYADYLPLYSIGLGWIVPAVVGAVIGLCIPSKK